MPRARGASVWANQNAVRRAANQLLSKYNKFLLSQPGDVSTTASKEKRPVDPSVELEKNWTKEM